jgi:ethanolamine utilization cobalamin adenosyltransferase
MVKNHNAKMIGRAMNLCGLELRGDTPISPETRNFLESKGATIHQQDGLVTLSTSVRPNSINHC